MEASSPCLLFDKDMGEIPPTRKQEKGKRNSNNGTKSIICIRATCNDSHLYSWVTYMYTSGQSETLHARSLDENASMLASLQEKYPDFVAWWTQPKNAARRIAFHNHRTRIVHSNSKSAMIHETSVQAVDPKIKRIKKIPILKNTKKSHLRLHASSAPLVSGTAEKVGPPHHGMSTTLIRSHDHMQGER